MNHIDFRKEIVLLFQKYYLPCEYKIEIQDSAIDDAIEIYKYDYNRYFDSFEIVKEKFYNRIELIGIFLYRIAHSFYLKNNENQANHFANLSRIISGFEIYYSAEIGEGLKINHGLGTVIGARVKIGKNALIHQNVTFGDKNNGRPEIKNNVTVYAGAKILGKIICEDNSIIAANCVCMIDVPKNSIIAGIPGKIIKK